MSLPGRELEIRTLAEQPRRNPSLIPLHARLSWLKSRTAAGCQVMRFYQTVVRTHSLASSDVMVDKLSSALTSARQSPMLRAMKWNGAGMTICRPFQLRYATL